MKMTMVIVNMTRQTPVSAGGDFDVDDDDGDDVKHGTVLLLVLMMLLQCMIAGRSWTARSSEILGVTTFVITRAISMFSKSPPRPCKGRANNATGLHGSTHSQPITSATM